MGLYESDPRDIGYIALYIAIKVWHQPISADTALRIAKGTSPAKKPELLTNEKYKQIKSIIEGPSFRSFNSLERRFRINRYNILARLGKEMFGEITTDEGVVSIMRIDILLKKLKEEAENCNATNCEKCFLDSESGNGLTWCEVICDMQFDERNRPIKTLPGSKIRVEEILTGETESKGMRVYKTVLERLEVYLDKNRNAKLQDIVSEALLRYLVKEEQLEKLRGSK